MVPQPTFRQTWRPLLGDSPLHEQSEGKSDEGPVTQSQIESAVDYPDNLGSPWVPLRNLCSGGNSGRTTLGRGTNRRERFWTSR